MKASMYDIVIKGGRVIDPAQNIDAVTDVAINNDKIASVSKDIPPLDAKQVIDATGKIVTPGLIDMHCHVCDSIKLGTEPDTAGVRQGVTTVVDAGSAGEAIFPAFPKYIIPKARTSIFCFLHISSLGLSIHPELRELEEINVEATKSAVESHPGLIKGIKIRLVGPLMARNGLEIFKTTKKLAKNLNLPIMVHVGDIERQVPASLTGEILPIMEKGDILSHIYTGRQGSPMLPDGNFIPEFRAASERGIVFDVASGRNNMTYEVARQGLAQRILPYVISSDLTCATVSGPVYGLTAMMSRFLTLGLTLNQVVTMTTINPARAINIADKKGSLKQRMDADVSILEVKSGKWNLEDAKRQILTVDQLIIPRLTVKAGKTVLPKMVAITEQTG